jgi:GT2 family glycosyltransferase
MLKKITVAILTRDGELDFLKKCLETVYAQDYKNIEIAIVDNGSKDGTKEYIEKQKSIKYHYFEENKGVSVGRNQLLKISTGDYILFMDNDILLHDNSMISNLIEYYAKLEKPAFLLVPLVDKEQMKTGMTRQYGGYYEFYGIRRNPAVHIDKILAHPDPIKIATIFCACVFFARKVWDDIGEFDESQLFNIDDDDLGTRAMVLGYYNYLFNKAFAEHIGGMVRRKANHTYDAWKYERYFSGKARPMFKNFQLRTLIWLFPWFVTFTFAIAIKWVIQNRYPYYFVALCKSICYFVKRFPETLQLRKQIQTRRVFSDKTIFSIKCPEYENRTWLQRILPI